MRMATRRDLYSEFGHQMPEMSVLWEISTNGMPTATRCSSWVTRVSGNSRLPEHSNGIGINTESSAQTAVFTRKATLLPDILRLDLIMHRFFTILMTISGMMMNSAITELMRVHQNRLISTSSIWAHGEDIRMAIFSHTGNWLSICLTIARR